MIKQYILNEEEFQDIQNKLKADEGIEEILNSYNELLETHENLVEKIEKIFDVREDGYIGHYITTPNYPNKLFTNSQALAELFNMFYAEQFFMQTGLKVDGYWKFE